jgi:hypothetical protein
MPDPAGAGNGNGGGTGDGQRRALPDDIRATLKEFFEVNNVADRDRKIFHQNAKLRHKNAELRVEVDRLTAAKPGTDALVLSKDDAAEYAAFKKLNLKAADLTALVKEHGELKVKDTDRSAEELFVDAADALGFENLPLFMRTMSRENLHLEFKEERVRDEETGKTEIVRVPMVRAKTDEKAQLVPLADYLEQEIPELIEALQLEPVGDDGDEDEEFVEGGERSSSATSFSRAAARITAGDPEARRAATRAAARASNSGGTGGVAIPVTRNARPASGSRAAEKKEREAYEEKKKSGTYAAL